jgi:hypothetical protein
MGHFDRGKKLQNIADCVEIARRPDGVDYCRFLYMRTRIAAIKNARAIISSYYTEIHPP